MLYIIKSLKKCFIWSHNNQILGKKEDHVLTNQQIEDKVKAEYLDPIMSPELQHVYLEAQNRVFPEARNYLVQICKEIAHRDRI